MMNAFEFVCHAPSNYYKDKSTPYPTKSTKPDLAYISTMFGPEIRPVPSREEIFGLKDVDAKVTVAKGTGRGKGRGARKAIKTEKNPVNTPTVPMPEIKMEIKEEVV